MRINICILGVMLTCFNSCNKWLDVKPKTEIEANEMFDTEKGFKDALTACYIKLNSTQLYGQKLTMTDIEYLAQHWSLNTTTYVNEIELRNFNFQSDYARNAIATIYGSQYNVIAQANIILENLIKRPNVIASKSVRSCIQAEALAVRAFCHMDVLRLFGQMPQQPVKQISLPYAETVSIKSIPKYSNTEFVKRILRDLDQAEVLLKDVDPVMTYNFNSLDNFASIAYGVTLEDTYLGYRRFRFNYYAVRALKARLYLYLGDKSNAGIAANEVINAKDRAGATMVSLAGTADFNLENYTLPSECILALSNFEIKANINGLFAFNTLYLDKNKLTNDLFAGQAMSINNRATQVWNTTSVDQNGAITPTIRKYKQSEKFFNSNALATQQQVIPLVRLSEMFLIALETAPDLTEANRLYGLYMKARNVIAAPLTEEQLQQEIIREYRREFFAEGQMFYTYKRLGIRKMLWKDDREVSEDDYVLPLPESE